MNLNHRAFRNCLNSRYAIGVCQARHSEPINQRNEIPADQWLPIATIGNCK
ncbi:hypothetical protein P3W53_22090 [Pseudomonas denitrificans (nom. rej.)]|nr:hypothetical protein [Pseudomonas denitrificans (nom. rej.)]